MANLQHSASAHIDASADAVWALLTDVDAWPTWNSTILEASGQATLGATVKVTTTLAPKRPFSLTVKEASAPTRMVWASGNAIFGGTRVYTVTAAASGVDFSMDEQFTGLFKGPIAKSIPDMDDVFATFAADLKAAAEAHA